MRIRARARMVLPVGVAITVAAVIHAAQAEVAPRRGAADARVRKAVVTI